MRPEKTYTHQEVGLCALLLHVWLPVRNMPRGPKRHLDGMLSEEMEAVAGNLSNQISRQRPSQIHVPGTCMTYSYWVYVYMYMHDMLVLGTCTCEQCGYKWLDEVIESEEALSLTH